MEEHVAHGGTVAPHREQHVRAYISDGRDERPTVTSPQVDPVFAWGKRPFAPSYLRKHAPRSGTQEPITYTPHLRSPNGRTRPYTQAT
jgi:hypothetical protein